MAWRGTLSRSLLSAARSPSSALPSPAAASRLRRTTISAARVQHRRISLAPPRNFGELGCAQSLLPLHSAVAAARLTPHLSINSRACCELSQGRNGKDG